MDGGENWEILETPEAEYRSLAISGDGKKVWAAAGKLVLESLKKNSAPRITHFSAAPPDLTPEFRLEDPDTAQEKLSGAIEVIGPGLVNVRFPFGAGVQALAWPKGAFMAGQKYKFHLRVTDGWNITVQDFDAVMPSSNASRALAAVAATEVPVPELQDVDLRGATAVLDGGNIAIDQIITRGADGKAALTPSENVLQKLKDGFHGITIAEAQKGILRQIGFYKEQLGLKLFSPYRKSYALIIAIGNYPDAAGYPKLTSAVTQGKKLEATLRAQGFEVLPPLYDQDATKNRIEQAIRRAPAGPEDRLFIYFGGHGDDQNGFQGKRVGYLIPFDGRKTDLWETAIPLERLTSDYSARLAAKHVLFALDSCQSGLAVTRGSAPDPDSDALRRFKAFTDIEALTSEAGRTILAAGTGGQDALDVSGGIFTAALIDGISGKADFDRNGVVDYYELFAFIWGSVNTESRAWVRKQQPADLHIGNGRWVFAYDRKVRP